MRSKLTLMPSKTQDGLQSAEKRLFEIENGLQKILEGEEQVGSDQ